MLRVSCYTSAVTSTLHLLFFAPKFLSASAQRAVIPLYLPQNIRQFRLRIEGGGALRRRQHGDACAVSQRLQQREEYSSASRDLTHSTTVTCDTPLPLPAAPQRSPRRPVCYYPTESRCTANWREGKLPVLVRPAGVVHSQPGRGLCTPDPETGGGGVRKRVRELQGGGGRRTWRMRMLGLTPNSGQALR